MMNDPRVRRAHPGAAAKPPDTMTELLEWLAGVFAGRQPDRSVTAGRLLGELLTALSLHRDLSRGVYPPRGAVLPPSAALTALELAVAAAVEHHAANPQSPPNRLPVGLEVDASEVERNLQTGRSSAADEITVREAADLLGRSPEMVRLLVQAGEIDGWRETEGLKRWHVVRASVVAYRQRRDGYGPGSGERQPVA